MSQQIPDLDIAPSVDKDGDYFLVYRADTGTLERVTADQILSDVVYREIARTTLGIASDTLTVNNIPAKTHLRFLLKLIPTGGTITGAVRFNNDTGSNYNLRYSDNYAAGASVVSNGPTGMADAGASSTIITGVIEILNIANQEKLLRGDILNQGTVGAANLATSRRYVGKWSNTSTQITRFDIVNGGTGDFAIGSEVIVMGGN